MLISYQNIFFREASLQTFWQFLKLGYFTALISILNCILETIHLLDIKKMYKKQKALYINKRFSQLKNQ